jgi:hypothetical protein
MSDALVRMAAFLIQSPGWKPDRATADQIRRCSGCKSWKHVDHFTPTDHLCRPCRKVLSHNNRKRVAAGKWSV